MMPRVQAALGRRAPTADLVRTTLGYLADRVAGRMRAAGRAGRTVAVVDLSDVSFVDSTALGVLVSGVKRLRSAGGDLRLVVTQPRISKVFEITGLNDVFRIYSSAEEAVRA